MSMYGEDYKFDTVNWMEVAKANGVTDFTVEDAEAMYAIAREEVSFGNPVREWDRKTNRFTVYDDREGHKTIGVGHKLKKGEGSFKTLSWSEGIDLYMKDYVDHRKQAQDLMGEWEGTPRWQVMAPAQRQWVLDKVFNLGATGTSKYTNSISALLRGDRDRVMESKVHSGGTVINRGKNSNANYDQMWGSMTLDERKASVHSEKSIQAWRESVSK